MRTEDMKPGTPVWYEAVRHDTSRTYAGVIDTEPWMLGGHTLVVNLRDMEDRYAEKHYGHRRVSAASVLHLRPRSV